MKTLPTHLNRLDAALRKQGVALKRHQLLEAAAAAFGYHNSNEMTAAAKRGGLDPAKARYAGTAGHDSGRDLVLLEDPVAGATYAIERERLEDPDFGVSPYGTLLDLRAAAAELDAADGVVLSDEPAGSGRAVQPQGDHPVYGSAEWRRDVDAGDTRLSYGDWVAERLQEDADRAEDAKVIFLTNGCCECAHGSPELLARYGLKGQMDEGHFHPLTRFEEEMVAEDEATLPNGMTVLFGYSVLHEGQKWACPVVTLFHDPGEEVAAGAKMAAYRAHIAPKIEAMGGKVLIDPNAEDDRICLNVLVPFKAVIRAHPDFESWKLAFAKHAMPADGPRARAIFHPQAWINDNAVDVDPEGETEWDVTHLVVAKGRDARLLKDNRDNTDSLRDDREAPRWIRDWRGPFRVEVEDSVRAYFDAL